MHVIDAMTFLTCVFLFPFLFFFQPFVVNSRPLSVTRLKTINERHIAFSFFEEAFTKAKICCNLYTFKINFWFNGNFFYFLKINFRLKHCREKTNVKSVP